jgi:hypothetical protein
MKKHIGHIDLKFRKAFGPHHDHPEKMEKGHQMMAEIEGKNFLVNYEGMAGKNFLVRTKDNKLKVVAPYLTSPLSQEPPQDAANSDQSF